MTNIFQKKRCSLNLIIFLGCLFDILKMLKLLKLKNYFIFILIILLTVFLNFNIILAQENFNINIDNDESIIDSVQKNLETSKNDISDISDSDAIAPIDKPKSYKYRVEIALQNETRIEGNINLTLNNIELINRVGEIIYEKSVSFKDINSIEILEWKPIMTYYPNNSANKTEIEYTFYPFRYRIRLKDGTIYYQERRFEILDSLILENQYGRTNIYFIFIDYWIMESRNRGRWYNSKFDKFDSNNRNPNPLTGISINFIEYINN